MTTRPVLIRLLARWACLLMMSVLFVCGPALAADESPATTAEIAHLMTFIRTSNCDFLRNGAWHASQAAHDHIMKKLNYIRFRDTLGDAEQFIELAATRSSLSGEAYQVRCPGTPVQECRRWLLDELGRVRKGGTPAR